MKKTILLALFLLFFIVILGCSDKQGDKFMELSEEERQQMFEERQQMRMKSCEGKNEGDACVMESFGGDVDGTCGVIDESLICMLERKGGKEQWQAPQ